MPLEHMDNTGSESCITCDGCPAGYSRSGCVGGSAGSCVSRPSGEYKVNTGSGSYNTCDTRGVWQVIRAAGAAETRQEAVYHAPRESTVQGQNRVWQLYHVPRRQVTR